MLASSCRFVARIFQASKIKSAIALDRYSENNMKMRAFRMGHFARAHCFVAGLMLMLPLPPPLLVLLLNTCTCRTHNIYVILANRLTGRQCVYCTCNLFVNSKYSGKSKEPVPVYLYVKKMLHRRRIACVQ